MGVNTYCSAEDVRQFLQLGTAFSSSTTPTKSFVESLIRNKEAWIDGEIQRSFRLNTVTNKFYDLEFGYEEGVGIPVYLTHRDIITLDTSEGDKVEIWDGSSYVDWTDTKTEGRASDFWLDYDEGMLYLVTRFSYQMKKAVRMNYRYGKIPTIESLDACDAITGWAASTDAQTETLNTTTYKEGAGSINMGKDGTASTTFSYSKTLSSTYNLTDKDFKLWLYVTDTTELASSTAMTIYLGNDSSNYCSKSYDRADLSNGWNLISFALSDTTLTGAFDETAIDYLKIEFSTTDSSDTITLGNLLMDYWRFSKSNVPGDIKELCYTLVAIDLVSNEDSGIELPETGGGKQLTFSDKTRGWKERVSDILADYKPWIAPI